MVLNPNPIIAGSDQIFVNGTANDDLFIGQELNNTLRGEAGNDTILAQQGDDIVQAGMGDDLVRSGAGNDSVRGGLGNDSLFGAAGNDTLDGGSGDDLLVGGLGSDNLTGGFGRDTFAVGFGSGGATLLNADSINDFVVGEDRIFMVDGLGFRSLNIFQGTGTFVNDTIIQNLFTGEFLAILRNINAASLTRESFVRADLQTRDTTPPLAGNLMVTNIATAGGTTHTFTVQYADAIQLDARSFRDGNLRVTGPNNFQQAARLVSVDTSGNGNARTVTYSIDAPGGTWEANDNGPYQIELLGGQIFDGSGNVSAGRNLGSFGVNTPIPEVPVSVSANSVVIREDAGGDGVLLTFTRTEYLRNALNVNFTIGGTAELGRDYTITPTPGVRVTGDTGTISFLPGGAIATLRIVPVADTILETDESILFTIASGAGYFPAETNGSTTVTLQEDESEILLSLTPEQVTEDGNTALVYTFTRNGFADRDVTVNFSVGGTAQPGDYTATAETGITLPTTGTTGTVVFRRGETAKVLRILPNADTTLEPDETLELTLRPGTGYGIGTPEAVRGTILNDEAAIALSVNTEPATPSATVLEDSGAALVYTFTRSGFTGNAIGVNFQISGSAQPADFTLDGATLAGNTGTVTFAADATTAVVRVVPVANTVLNENRTVTLTTVAGTGYVVGSIASVTGTIAEDESAIALRVEPVQVAEDGSTALSYTFERSGFLNRALTVNFGIGGSASLEGNEADYRVTLPDNATYTAAGGTVTFAANEISKILTIRPIADNRTEVDETVLLTLNPGDGYVPTTTGPVQGTLIDDDATVSLAVDRTSVTEDGDDTLTFTFTRTGSLSNALTVNFSVGGTASFGAEGDYTADSPGFTATRGSVSFAAGSDTATLTLNPTAELEVIEADETVILTLLPGSGYTAASAEPLTVAIANDDGIIRNTSDSGAGSLRQAILAANNPGSIANPTLTVLPSISGNITLTSALPTLTRDLILVGTGSRNLRLVAGGSFRVLEVDREVEATVRGLAIANGNANLGGGILNNGNLTLNDVLIEGNNANLGGGIYNAGTLVIGDRNRIVNNTAQNSGGGIYNVGNLTVTATDNTEANTNVFSGNIAAVSFGGGIFNDGTAIVQFANFLNNRSNPDLRRNGGAIYNLGSASQLSVGNSFFDGTPANSPNAIGGSAPSGTPVFTNLGNNVFP